MSDQEITTAARKTDSGAECSAGGASVSIKPPRRVRRRILFALWITAGLMGVLYVFGPIIAAPYIQGRLQNMVSDHLWAELRIGKLSYDFPFGVRVRDAALVARDEKGGTVDLIRAKELELSLAEIPRKKRPLIISRVVIHEPSIHLIMTDDGLVGGKRLVKTFEERIASEEARTGEKVEIEPTDKHKPSDFFRLRKFDVRDAKIMFQDRRGGAERPSVVWDKLGAELNIEPASGSHYAFALAARNAPVVTGEVKGGFDIDAAVIDVERFAMGLKVERDRPQSQLPPGLQELLGRYHVEGGLTFSGKSHVEVRAPEASTYDAVLDLPRASARISGEDRASDWVSARLRFTSAEREAAHQEVTRPVALTTMPAVTSQPASRPSRAVAAKVAKQAPVVVRIERFEAGTGDTVLRVEKGEAVIDPEAAQWRVKDLLCRLEFGDDRSGLPSKVEQALERLRISGRMQMTATAAGPLRPLQDKRVMDQVEYQVIAYPRDLAIVPPKWQLPFTKVSGTVRANREAITLENVEGDYQGDRYFLQGARIPMDGIERVVRVNEIVGTIQPTGRVEDYPKPFEFIARELRPAGMWYVTGSFARRKGLPPGEKPEYRFDIRTDEGAGSLSKYRIPLTGVRAEIVATPQLVEIRRIDAKSLGGTVVALGRVVPGKGAAMTYEGQGWVRNVDVKALGTLVSKDGKEPKRLSGRGNVNVRISGTGKDLERRFTAADTVKASGQFEVLDGDFYELSMVKQISDNARVKYEATTVGQAAGTFEIANRVVTFPQMAISAPVLGLTGSGRVAFDGGLDLEVVAAPLADWREQVKRTKIPVVSDVAGEVLGGLQKMLNTATKTLLYEFHVTGRVGEPKVAAVPTPVLTEGVARLFGAMVKGGRIGAPLEGEEKK